MGQADDPPSEALAYSLSGRQALPWPNLWTKRAVQIGAMANGERADFLENHSYRSTYCMAGADDGSRLP